MKSLIVGIALAASASVASAQAAVTSGHSSFYVGPYAGYMQFGNLGDLNENQSLSLENGFFYGAQAGFSFSPNVAILANLGYTNSNFAVKNTNNQSNQNNLNQGSKVGVYLYDADLQLKLPFLANRMGTMVAPFIQAGVGQIKYTYDKSALLTSDASSTNFTYNAGLGLDVQVRPLIGIRLMAKDYITSFDFNKFGDANKTSGDKVANNLAYTAGLNFGF